MDFFLTAYLSREDSPGGFLAHNTDALPLGRRSLLLPDQEHRLAGKIRGPTFFFLTNNLFGLKTSTLKFRNS